MASGNLAHETKGAEEREGDHLVGQMWGENTTHGAMDIYPASETNFFIKLDGSQLTFVKDDKGEVTQVIHHLAGIPDHIGRKVSGPATRD